MLAVGGLAAAAFAEQDNGLVLPRGQKVPVGRLSHCVDMRCCVLTPAAFKHVHHLQNYENLFFIKKKSNRITWIHMILVFFRGTIILKCYIQQQSLSHKEETKK